MSEACSGHNPIAKDCAVLPTPFTIDMISASPVTAPTPISAAVWRTLEVISKTVEVQASAVGVHIAPQSCHPPGQLCQHTGPTP